MSEYKRQGGFQNKRGGGFNRGGDRGGFRGGSRGGDRRDQQMFSTVCASCGKACEVPFRPNGDKPVYCNDCFRNNKQDGGGSFNRRDDHRGDRRENTREFTAPQNDGVAKQLESLNIKLDKIISILSRSTETQTLKDTVEKVVAPEKNEKTATKKVAKKKVSKSK